MTATHARRYQLLLTAHGIDPGPIDGILGPKTQAALQRAQDAGVDILSDVDNKTGFLEGIETVPAHDVRGQWTAPPKSLCIHYGAGTQESDVAILTRQDSIYISAHFSIGRDGKIVQMVPIDSVALHCGDGEHGPSLPYSGRTLNYTTVGIELENLGWLNRSNEIEAWREEGGRSTPRVPIKSCLHATHPLRGGEYYWPTYPDAQKRALIELTHRVMGVWPSIEHAFGHDEVSTRKYDPGPAFNMAEFRRFFHLKP